MDVCDQEDEKHILFVEKYQKMGLFEKMLTSANIFDNVRDFLKIFSNVIISRSHVPSFISFYPLYQKLFGFSCFQDTSQIFVVLDQQGSNTP